MLGLFLEHIRDHLRLMNVWTARFCDVQFDAIPPFDSPEWYVAIDSNGVDQVAHEAGNYMNEESRFQIGIWRRDAVAPRTQSGINMLYTDPYRTDRQTLDKIERLVIRALVAYPERNELVGKINAVIQSNQEVYGACVLKPLRYLGRSKNEHFVPAKHVGGDDIPTYLGRRLDFVGLNRIQEYDELLR